MGMTKAAKIRAKIAAGDGNLRFEQLDAYLISIGATRRQPSSHVVYLLPAGGMVTIVKPHGGRKTVAVRYVRNLHEQLEKEGL